jgi:hypothetical protein
VIDHAGLTPRAVTRLYQLIDKNRGVFDVTVQAYMIELYLDAVIDLFWKVREKVMLDVSVDESALSRAGGKSARP